MSVLASFDVAGRRRSPAATAEFHLGRVPGNKGMNLPGGPATGRGDPKVLHRHADPITAPRPVESVVQE